jgi:hypothetical protein
MNSSWTQQSMYTTVEIVYVFKASVDSSSQPGHGKPFVYGLKLRRGRKTLFSGTGVGIGIWNLGFERRRLSATTDPVCNILV